MKKHFTLLVSLALLASSPVHATTIQFSLVGKGGIGLIAGNETSTVTGSTGTGGQINGGITFDDVTKVLTLNVGWGVTKGFANLSGNATGAALCGPTASSFPASYNESGGELIDLKATPFSFVAISSGGGVTGHSTTLNATNEAALLAGKLYLTIRTKAHSTGEIRANLVPVTPTVPPSIIVTTNADSGTGSLRVAIAASMAAPGADTITFDPHVFTGGANNIILVTSASQPDGIEPTAFPLRDIDSLTIDASALPVGLTLDGGLAGFKFFYLYNDETVVKGNLTLRALTLAHARGTGSDYPDGGAIYNDGNMTLDRCTLFGNQAANNGAGGAIYNVGTVALTNCTLTGNQSGIASLDGPGSAIYNRGTATLTNCTVTGNTSRRNGAICNSFLAALTLTNTIVSGNTDLDGTPDVFNNQGITLNGVNFIGAGISDPYDSGTVTGPAPLTGNAMLGTLADNGGLTKTVMPRPGSPCIDPTGGATSSVLTTDQRGQPRVVDGDQTAGAILDIGAVEAPTFSTANSIAFATATRTFYEEVGTVQVTINRSGYVGGTSNALITPNPGSATPLPNGTTPPDYTAGTTVVSFAAGEVSKTVSITLTSDPANKEPNESFTLTLSNVHGTGTTLGEQSTCTINIIDAYDIKIPTLTVATPVNNTVIPEVADPIATVTGSATDNQGLAAVEISLNGSPFTAAKLTLAASGKTGTFQQTVNFNTSPIPALNDPLGISPSVGGTHSIAVRSVDTRGNRSSVITRSVVFRMIQPLTVTVNDNSRGTVTAGFLGTTDRNVGQTYFITATPKAGSVFAGWTVLGFNYSDMPTLNFTMPDVSSQMSSFPLQANFVPTPFTTSVIGTYNGFVLLTFPPASIPTDLNQAIGVLQNAKVTSTGSFTSTLKIAGLSVPVSGSFDAQGRARFGRAQSLELSITRVNKPSIIVTLNLNMVGQTLTGTVRQRLFGQDIAHSTISAARSRYSAANKIPPALAGTVSKPYTILLPSNPVPDLYHPQGTGYATATLAANGTLTYSGKLADNTSFSGSSALVFFTSVKPLFTPLSNVDIFPLFASLYGGRGAVAGYATLADADAASDDLDGALFWARPQLTASQWYPDGWASYYAVEVKGNRYDIPPATPARSVFPGLQALSPNLTLTFTNGLLTTSPLNFDQTVSPANVVTNVPVAPSPTMKITKATGLITGSFPHTDGTKPAYQGVIQSKGTLQGAGGYFMTTSPKVANGLGQSGNMRAVAK